MLVSEPTNAEPIAGVDFEGETQSEFDRNPDDPNPDDGITVSSGTDSPMFDGWTLLFFDGSGGANGNLRNDNGANTAGATTPDFPARLEGGRTGSWSITIDPGVVLNLDRIEFDVRGATGGTGRNGQFRTSLDVDEPFLWDPDDDGSFLWKDDNLPGRTSGDWQRIVVDLSGSLYQNLTDQTVSFIWGTTNAIDLDTIEVHGTIGDGPPEIRLVIEPNPVTAGNYDFEWDSQDGKVYDLVSSTDLSGPIEEWTVWDGRAGLPATAPDNVLEDIFGGDDPMRFFAIVEKDAPPPPPLFSEDFEEDDGGFTLVGSPNEWEWGTPNSDNDAGLLLTTGNDGSTNCWGTNLGDGGTPSGTIDTAADSVLRSPAIDLTGVTGATLNFAAAIDAAADDTVEVLVREVGTDTLLDTLTPFTAPVTADWENVGPLDLSAGDNTNIYLEFRFQGGSDLFIGLYIDDVVVTP
jgi:hypothetical protein